MKSIIVRGAFCMAILAASVGLASACGNALIYPMLFRAYPDAGRAYDAELAARRMGDLSTAVWSMEQGLTSHQWSLMRARAVVDRLAARLHRSTQAEAKSTGSSVSILLVDEVYVAQLDTGARKAALNPLMVGHSKSDISLYTTANALRALVDGRMRWHEAVERDLVVVAGAGHQQEKVSALLSTALSGSAFAN